MAYISVKRQPGRLAALLLAGTCLSPVGASAQTWIGGTGTGFETGTNWSGGSAPTSAQTGTFGASVNTSVSMTVPARRTAVFSSMPERPRIRSM
jgi:hypothetical protein